MAVVDANAGQAQAVAAQFGCKAFSRVEDLFGLVDAVPWPCPPCIICPLPPR